MQGAVATGYNILGSQNSYHLTPVTYITTVKLWLLLITVNLICFFDLDLDKKCDYDWYLNNTFFTQSICTGKNI